MHPIFSRFKLFEGQCPATHIFDSFLGTTLRPEYVTGSRAGVPSYPPFDEEYFEWIDLLESVAEAKDRYVFLELGAGYGRWSGRAAAACRQLEIPCWVIAVEAEPTHFEWLKQNFVDNDIRGEALYAAISETPGTVPFHTGNPAGWYGQAIGGAAQVPSITLRSLLTERIDLIDFDIQGAELEAIQASIEPLTQTTKRLHIGTHSREIEAGLREVLKGWQCLADYSLGQTNQTPWGAIEFVDGVQSYLNTKLL